MLPIGIFVSSKNFFGSLIFNLRRAAYGYDVNAPEFKEWQASQQQQYAQYYASQGYDPAAYGGATAPQPSDAAPPPPPPPS